ncbi:FU domain-containing protein T48 isoform X2 [Choristoneura fumiferana]
MRRAALALTVTLLAMASAAHAQLRPADAPPTNDTRCGPECVRCAADGCIKCARLLVWPGGTCARVCPSGSREAWAHDDHLMGRVCYPANTYNEVLVGGACGVVACIVLVAAGATYAKCRSGVRARSQPLPQRPKHDDDTRLRDFHKQLDCLRPHAYTLLAILNHTRNQVRELYQLGNNDAAMAYSCVMSDLAKLLILLNKQHVPVVPDEWPRLASWAERILKRYSRNPLPAQTQEGPLVNFLAPPPSQSSDSEITQQSFSTFKPPSYSPTSYDSNIEKELESQCEWNDVRPPSYSQIEKERETIVLSDPWERRPIVRRESVWLEDELFEMTRRPQDELTTEL